MRKWLLWARCATVFVGCLAVSGAHAQSLTSIVGVRDSNSNNSDDNTNTVGPVDAAIPTAGADAWSGSAAASTNYGESHAVAHLSGTIDFSKQFEAFAGANSIATDKLTFSGGTGAGFVSFTFDLSGVISGSNFEHVNDADSHAFQDIRIFDDTTGDYHEQRFFYRGEFSGIPDGHIGDGIVSEHIVTLLFPIVYGDAMTVQTELGVWIDAIVDQDHPSVSLDTTFDFSHTSILSGITVYNADKSINTGASWTSASGTPYGSVPEPATLSAMTAGVAGIMACRRRRIRR